jgi:hypothetical protein
MDLAMGANLAQILTAGIAAVGYGKYLCERGRNRKTLETYLEGEQGDRNKGQRTIINIAAYTGLTESEILDASRRSKHVVRSVKADAETNLAAALLFQYRRNGKSN